MKNKYFNVTPPLTIKEGIYNELVKSIKKALAPWKNHEVNVYEDPETDKMIINIRQGDFITYGCSDGKPWTEADKTALLYERLIALGFKPSFFQLQKVKTPQFDQKMTTYLHIGFIKDFPKKDRIKITQGD